ncbi:unnamed protein product [Closterium sp. NIES-53]
MVRRTFDVERETSNHQWKDVSNRWKKGGDAIAPDFTDSHEISFTQKAHKSIPSATTRGPTEPTKFVGASPYPAQDARILENSAKYLAITDRREHQKHACCSKDQQITRIDGQITRERKTAQVHELEGEVGTCRDNEIPESITRGSDGPPRNGVKRPAEIVVLVRNIPASNFMAQAAESPDGSADDEVARRTDGPLGGSADVTFVPVAARAPSVSTCGPFVSLGDGSDRSCRSATGDGAREADGDRRTSRRPGGDDCDSAERGEEQCGTADGSRAAEGEAAEGGAAGGAAEGELAAADSGEAQGGGEGGRSWWGRVTGGRLGKRRVSTEVSPPRGSSSLEAVFNGVNVLTGIGILTTPYALAQSGWFGLLLLAVTSLLYLLTARLLRACMDHAPATDPHTSTTASQTVTIPPDTSTTALHTSTITTYPDIGAAAFGRTGRVLTSLVLYGELFAVSVELLILEGDSLAFLFPSFAPHGVPLGSSLRLSANQVFLIIAALIVLPTVWLRKMSLLAYVSVGGLLAALVTVVGVAWVAAVGTDDAGSAAASASAATSAEAAAQGGAALLRVQGIPVAMGIFGFCFSGHAVFPTIYRSMDKPQHFNRVLLICFTVCTCIYGGIAILGYSMYGQATAAQITLNLPPALTPSSIVLWTTIISPITKFAITITPVALALESSLSSLLSNLSPPNLASCTPYCVPRFKHRGCSCNCKHTPLPLSWLSNFPGFKRVMVSSKTVVSLTVRTLLVMLAAAAGLLLPFFALVMTLTGSLLSISISLLLPTACHLSIKWRQLSRASVACHVAILLGGTAAAVTGTIYAVRGIAAGGGGSH